MSVTSLKPDWTVFVTNKDFQSCVPKSRLLRVLHKPDIKEAELALNVFIVAAADQMKLIAPIVHVASKDHRLRALFIRQTPDSSWMPQVVQQLGPPSPSNLSMFTDPVKPQRIIHAWLVHGQDELIADATVVGDNLLVASCGLETFSIPFSHAPLRQIPASMRAEFVIDADGNSISWDEAGIELDLQGLRTIISPELRVRARVHAREFDATYGRAIAGLRVQAKLRQGDIVGLSERHVGRIESGHQRVTARAISCLARAHSLTEAEFMEQIAEMIHSGGQALEGRRRVRKQGQRGTTITLCQKASV